MSDPLLPLLVLSVALVVAYDFTNGFHDASNMVATMVASRAMPPGWALVLVAAATFLGPILGGVAVANAVADVVDLHDLSAHAALLVVASGLLGAVGWNLVTWLGGIPSSSSFALFGALAGATLHGADAGRVQWGFAALAEGRLTGLVAILAALTLSPILGLGLGFAAMKTSQLLLRGARSTVNRRLRHAQILTSGALAFAHGTNDAQKGMGLVTLCLILAGRQQAFDVPLWVVLMCATSITLGTLAGGWRIIRTLGFGIYRIRPLHALDSQIVSALVVFVAGQLGGPVSTTHVVTTSIMGVGAAEHPRRVRWSRARRIGVTWLTTLPATAVFGAVVHAIAIAILPS